MANTRRSRFVMVNGIRTHYTESGGDGPVILAMHGGGHGSSGEAGLGRLLDLLGDRYRVIGLDSIGGYGETDPTVALIFGRSADDPAPEAMPLPAPAGAASSREAGCALVPTARLIVEGVSASVAAV